MTLHPFDKAHFYRPDVLPCRRPSLLRIVLEWGLIVFAVVVLYGLILLMLFTNSGMPLR